MSSETTFSVADIFHNAPLCVGSASTTRQEKTLFCVTKYDFYIQKNMAETISHLTTPVGCSRQTTLANIRSQRLARPQCAPWTLELFFVATGGREVVTCCFARAREWWLCVLIEHPSVEAFAHEYFARSGHNLPLANSEALDWFNSPTWQIISPMGSTISFRQFGECMVK